MYMCSSTAAHEAQLKEGRHLLQLQQQQQPH